MQRHPLLAAKEGEHRGNRGKPPSLRATTRRLCRPQARPVV